ncbi:MAG: molybdate ABC transporter substrate-binding protein [Isosphaeraceae bacterium]
MSASKRQLRRDHSRFHAWMWVVMLGLIAGCGEGRRGPGGQAPASAGPLRIAAASDLQAALPALAERFRAAGGAQITPTFQSSGVLARQIEQGAPYDLFFAANEGFVRDLAARGAIRLESVRIYALGSLVLAVHRDMANRIRSLADLARPEVKRIAVANPETAPYGQAGKQALERSGLWESLRSRIVETESVRQALVHVQNGDAEAALVGRAIADVPEVGVFDVDPALYDPIVQALGIVSDSSRQHEAETFASFVLGEEGQGILKQFGFRPGVDASKRVDTGESSGGRQAGAKAIK